MIPMPETYQPYADVRRVDFGLSFGVVAVDAADLAVASTDTGQFPSSQLQQTHDRVELSSAAFATLEHNIWILDGSMTVYPEDLDNLQTGYLSEEYSGDNGNFQNPPKISFVFSIPQDSYGLTFRFDDQIPESWPRGLKVDFFNDTGELLFSGDLSVSSSYAWIETRVQGYSKIDITFLSTAVPRRRARLVEIIFGLVANYDRSRIARAAEKQSIDILSESLASSQLDITIDNADKLYNLINPTGVYEYLQNGQYVNYWYKIGGQILNAGVKYFYSAESDDGGLTASITFNDRLIFLENAVFNGGASGTWQLQEAVTEILSAAGVGSVPAFEDGLGSTIIRKCIPQETDCREALRLCTQAAMCVCCVNRNDTFYFFRPGFAAEPDDQLTRDRIEEEPKVVVGDRFNAVMVKRTDSYNEGSEEETYTLSAAEEGDIVLVKEISNDLINDMAAWAEWALPWILRRTYFDIDYRGNPALEIGDTVQVFDAFGVNGTAVIESHDLSFNGGLSGSIKARR